MKNYIKALSLVICGGFLLLTFGCEKEIVNSSIHNESPVEINNPPNDFVVNSIVNPCYTGLFDSIQVHNGMLKFVDMDHFWEVLACLEYQQEAHLQAFDDLYDHLTPEQMDSVEIAIGFNYWEPLEDFENLFQFNSRRDSIETLILAFLDTLEPDWENDPDDLDFFDEEKRAMLSPIGKAIINNEVVDFFSQGTEMTGPYSTNRENCRKIRKQKWFELISSSRGVKLKVKVNGRGIAVVDGYVREKAKIVNYRKGVFRWYRSREYLGVRIDGVPRSDIKDCSNPEPRNGEKSLKKRRSRKRVIEYDKPWEPYKSVYRSGENFGTFKVRKNNTITYVKTLEW